MTDDAQGPTLGSAIGYYDRVASICEVCWGEHPHFGSFGDGVRESGESFHVAQRAYTQEFVDKALSAMPLHRRQSGAKLRIVDLCCGKGGVLLDLMSRGAQGDYLGMDIYRPFLDTLADRMRQREIDASVALRLNVVLAEPEEFLAAFAEQPGVRGTVDLVVCEDSLYHIRDKGNLIRLVSQMLRPGGVFAISDFAVSEKLREDSDWNMHFVERERSSNPLPFGSCKKFGRKAEVYYGQEVLLEAHELLVYQRESRKTDIGAFYDKALQLLDDCAIEEDSRSRSKQTLTYLKALSDREQLQLIWWFAVKKSATDGACQRGGEELLRISVSDDGFFYRSGPELPVLREMQMSVSRQEYVVIAGETGSGKSTLLGLMSGLASGGKSVRVARKQGLRIAYVEQHPRLLENLTVGRALEVVAMSAGMKCKNRWVNEELVEIMDKCALLGLGGRVIKSLSGGQRQRAAIALALAARPDLLLLDEPLSAQDYFASESLSKLFADLVATADGPAVVHVTHRFDELRQRGGNRFIEVACGQLIEMQDDEYLYAGFDAWISSRWTMVLSTAGGRGRLSAGGVE